MKNLLKRYLKDGKEGFSLVELIIVIAIMAILIGIVALAVIPYLEKSRVGKDQQTVDTVYSAWQATIADQKITDDATVTITASTATVTPALTNVVSEMAKALSAADAAGLASGTVGKLESADAKGHNIICKYTKSTGTIEVYATNASGTKISTIASSNK